MDKFIFAFMVTCIFIAMAFVIFGVIIPIGISIMLSFGTLALIAYLIALGVIFLFLFIVFFL